HLRQGPGDPHRRGAARGAQLRRDDPEGSEVQAAGARPAPGHETAQHHAALTPSRRTERRRLVPRVPKTPPGALLWNTGARGLGRVKPRVESSEPGAERRGAACVPLTPDPRPLPCDTEKRAAS